MIEDWWTIVLIAKCITAWDAYLLAGSAALLCLQKFALRWYQSGKPVRCLVLHEGARCILAFVVALSAGLCLVNEIPWAT